jgi:hypothetical protein
MYTGTGTQCGVETTLRKPYSFVVGLDTSLAAIAQLYSTNEESICPTPVNLFESTSASLFMKKSDLPRKSLSTLRRSRSMIWNYAT